jgi:hypothetical protein
VAEMKFMLTRFLLISYLLAALVPAQIKEELGKLPQLAAHFQVHQTIEPSISFSEFLVMHYGSGFSRHQTDHSHSDLPGKGNHVHSIACVSSHIVFFEYTTLPEVAVRIPSEPRNSAFFKESAFLPSSHQSGIWQPPRMA